MISILLMNMTMGRVTMSRNTAGSRSDDRLGLLVRQLKGGRQPDNTLQRSNLAFDFFSNLYFDLFLTSSLAELATRRGGGGLSDRTLERPGRLENKMFIFTTDHIQYIDIAVIAGDHHGSPSASESPSGSGSSPR